MICDRCGYRNDDNAKNCSLCGAALEAKLSPEEQEKMLHRLSDRSDILTPSPLENVLKWIFLASAPVFFVLSVLFFKEAAPQLGIIITIFSIFAGVSAGYPKFMWSLSKLRIIFITDTTDLTPSSFWSFGRKVSYWLFYGVAVGLFLFALFYNR